MRQPKQYTIEQFLDTTSIAGGVLLRRRVADPVLVEQDRHLERVHGAGRPAARGRRSPRRPRIRPTPCRYFPNDDRILITRDQGGNELNHLYVRTPAGEEQRPDARRQAQGAVRRLDARRRRRSTSRPNERDPKFFDIYRYDAKTYERTLFYENKDGYFPSAVSDDGKWIALVEAEHDQRQRHLSSGTRRRKQTTHISKHKGNAELRAGRRSTPASKYLYYLTDDGGEFARLRRYDARRPASTKTSRRRTGTSSSRASRTTASIARPIDQQGRAAAASRSSRRATGRPVELPAIPNGGISRLRVRAQRDEAGVLRQRRSLARTISTSSISARSKLTKLTDSLSPEIDAGGSRRRADRPLQGARRHDDPERPLKPHQATAATQGAGARLGARRPRRPDDAGYSALHAVPGQPRLRRARHQQSRQLRLRQDVLRRRRQEARPRAAVGLRRRARSTCSRSTTWIANRIGIIGGSYGGYMVLAALAFQPRRVRRRRRPLRRRELDPHAREHPAVVGSAAQGALRRDGRSRRPIGRCSRRSRRCSTPTRSASR